MNICRIFFHNYFLIPLIFTSFFLPGCSLIDLSEDLKKQDQQVTITGKITRVSDTSAPVIAVLINDRDGLTHVLNYRIMKAPGEFHFFTDPGFYRVFAFEDTNRDNSFDYSEKVVRSPVLDMNTPGSQKEINFVISDLADKNILAEIEEIKKNGLINFSQSILNLGKIISLDADIFSAKNISRGLWQPYYAARTIPYGIFFLNDYDPDKKIVLFIHGISGSPAQFKSIIENLDHSRFQPMVAYYPSGLPLSLLAQYLNNLVEELHVRLDFDKVSLVAHSMGGLISRKFINIQSRHKESLIDSFISISTPWSGHAAVIQGLKLSPVIIPVWKDMAPDSLFLQHLFTPPLAEDIKHYLLFSFKGSSMTAGGNSDGVVSIASQLNPLSQQDSSLIRGFDENHSSILESRKVSSLINSLLINNIKKQIWMGL